MLHRCMLDWSRGMGSVCHRNIVILLYVTLVRCNGAVGIYPHLEGEWSLCHEYMCTLLFYM